MEIFLNDRDPPDDADIIGELILICNSVVRPEEDPRDNKTASRHTRLPSQKAVSHSKQAPALPGQNLAQVLIAAGWSVIGQSG
jgi:hypothetical protein